MNDFNPYASSLIDEPEAPSACLWRLEGNHLLARNKTVLPMVDLDTGEHGGTMKCIRRSIVMRGPYSTLGTVIIIGGYFILSSSFPEHSGWMPIFLFMALLIYKQMEALHANPAQRLHVMEYVGQKALHGRIARAKWRNRLSWLLLTLFALSFILPTSDLVPPHIQGFIGILFFANLVWTVADGPKARSLAGPPGWMKISPIHPDAIAYLSELQHPTSGETAPASARKRLVRTTWFHKFPIGMLVGKRKNPFVRFNIVVAKLLHSHMLTRDTYHFSEATPRELTELSPRLQDEIATWLASHPDWTFQTGELLPFPDGDVMVETAHLAPASLEHDLQIVCSWHLSAPTIIHIQNLFITWLTGGERVSTQDHAFIPLGNPRNHNFRARGSRDQIFQAHLRNCGGQPHDPPHDPSERAERILGMKVENDRHLTELGYQGEVREVG